MCQVYSALKLLFYVSKVLGFAPYTLLENGVLVPSRAARRYSMFLSVFFIAAEFDVFAFLKMEGTAIISTGSVLMFSSSWVTHLLSLVICIRSRKKFQTITQKIYTLDSMLHQTLHSHKKQFYTLLFQLVVGFLSLGSFLFWQSFYADNKEANIVEVTQNLFRLPVRVVCLFGDFIVVIQYINLVLFTGQHFSHINVKFAELVHLCSQRPSTARVSSTVTFRAVSTATSPKPVGLQLRDQVSVLVDIHNKLLDTVSSIISAYSLQILFKVAKTFVHITFSLYFFLLTLSKGIPAQYRVHILSFCLWNSFQLILIITCSDYTKRQVSVA